MNKPKRRWSERLIAWGYAVMFVVLAAGAVRALVRLAPVWGLG